MTNKSKRGLQYAATSPLVGIGCVLGGVALGVTAPYWWTMIGVRRGAAEDEAEALAAALNEKEGKGKGKGKGKVTTGDAKKLAALVRDVVGGKISPETALVTLKRMSAGKPGLQKIVREAEARFANA